MREIAQQSHHPAERSAHVNATMLNAPRHRPALRPAQRSRPPENPRNLQRSQASKWQQDISRDFLMLADPSDLESLVPEFRNARKRNRDIEDRVNRHRKRLATTREGREDDLVRADQSQPSFPSHTIRIFDADEEKTPHFRRRVLPNNFLNSQVTNKQSAPIRSRGNSPRPRQLKNLPSSSRKRKANDLDFVPSLPANFHERNIRHDSLGVSKASPKMSDLHPGSALPSNAIDFFAHRRADGENRRPLVQASPRRMRPHARSSDIPLHYMERRIPETPEFVAGTVVRESHQSHTPRHREEFSTQLDHMLGMSLGTRFPAVEAGSDSSSLLSRRQFEQEHKTFRSLLADEEIKPDDFSAEVQQIEMKILGEPDNDIRTFRVRNRRTAKRVLGSEREIEYGIRKGRGRNQFGPKSLNKDDPTVYELGVGVASGEKCSDGRNVCDTENTDIDMEDTERESYDAKDVEIELITTERNPIQHAREQTTSSMR